MGSDCRECAATGGYYRHRAYFYVFSLTVGLIDWAKTSSYIDHG